MKFNERWIREWVDPPIDTEELAARLTAVGLEVESVEPVAGTIEGVTVAEVVGVAPHPGADKLSLCEVDDGRGEPHRVVCGAPNVRRGLRTAFARIGARLPDGTKIRKSRIRGELSEGMLCSARELGLGEEADGILELDAPAPVGTDVADWLELDDVVMEVGLTPNRGDCLCIVGLAREVSVANRVTMRRREHAEIVKPDVDDVLPVVLDAPQRCPRYVGRVVRGIDPGAKSPLWMTERLRRCGVRPLSAVVDVTNYVMLELGQPMHAFDLAKLDSGIRVRNGSDGESLELLDGSVVELDADSLVIADESRPVALAGIMGGLESGVTGGTRDVFLESAGSSRAPLRWGRGAVACTPTPRTDSSVQSRRTCRERRWSGRPGCSSTSPEARPVRLSKRSTKPAFPAPGRSSARGAYSAHTRYRGAGARRARHPLSTRYADRRDARRLARGAAGVSARHRPRNRSHRRDCESRRIREPAGERSPPPIWLSTRRRRAMSVGNAYARVSWTGDTTKR